MSDQPPYPPYPPNQPPGWGQQPPPPPGPGNYSATDAIGYGWRAFTTYAGPLLGVTLIAILVPGIIQVIGTVLGGGQVFEFRAEAGSGFDFEFSGIGLLFPLLASLASLVISAAVIRLALDIVDGNQVSFGAMFSRINFGQVLIASILLSVAFTIGFVLCILPGIAVLFLTFLTNYFIVGKGQDAITAIKSSVSLVASNFGALVLFALVSFGCMLLGLLACCVGIVVAVPVVSVATAYTFRVLQGEPVRPMAQQ
ncbi:MAG: hypothetical protein L0H93_00880 [Nocardioides sp.]|nr:hypothetical protein [Nocardioides sp.]